MRLWPFSKRATKVAATHPSAPSSEVLTFLGGTPSGSGVTVTATNALQSMAVLDVRNRKLHLHDGLGSNALSLLLHGELASFMTIDRRM